MLLMSETERAGAGEPAPQAEPDDLGADDRAAPADDAPGAAPTWYERAQHRLRVDGVAFGQAVTRLREAEGWSSRTLSKKSGVPPTTLAKLERGETKQPDVEVATALALTFGYDSPGAMLGAGATARTPGGRRGAGAPAAMTLEQVVESLLRGVWAAQDGRPRATPVTVRLPTGPDAAPAGAAAAEEAVAGLRDVSGPGAVTLNVPLVVLVQPRTVG